MTSNTQETFRRLAESRFRVKKSYELQRNFRTPPPADTRQFEFIQYKLDRHEDFLAKLDNAVRNVLGSSLDIPRLYELARDLLKQFNVDSGFMQNQTSREEFHSRIVRAVETQGIPRFDDGVRLDRVLLFRILQDDRDYEVIQRAMTWLKGREPASQ